MKPKAVMGQVLLQANLNKCFVCPVRFSVGNY